MAKNLTKLYDSNLVMQKKSFFFQSEIRNNFRIIFEDENKVFLPNKTNHI